MIIGCIMSFRGVMAVGVSDDVRLQCGLLGVPLFWWFVDACLGTTGDIGL